MSDEKRVMMNGVGFEFDKDSIFSQVDLADAARVSPEEHQRIGRNSS
jgi:hypothetical protein